MSKIEKIILGCIFAAIPGCLIVYFAFRMIFGPSIKQVITERDLLENVSGVVDSLFTDNRNHDVRTAILKNKQIFEIEPEWESDIEVGDSLYKKKGSFLLEIYKRGGKKIVLDYRTTIASE